MFHAPKSSMGCHLSYYRNRTYVCYGYIDHLAFNESTSYFALAYALTRSVALELVDQSNIIEQEDIHTSHMFNDDHHQYPMSSMKPTFSQHPTLTGFAAALTNKTCVDQCAHPQRRDRFVKMEAVPFVPTFSVARVDYGWSHQTN